MGSRPSVTVLGGGNAALTAAADLTLRGFETRLLESREFGANVRPVMEAGGIQMDNPKVALAGSGFAKVSLTTTDAAAAMDGADIVLFAVPAYAEKYFTELIAPFVRPEQLVVLFCGNFGGALEFAHALRSKGATRLPLIAETEACVYAGQKSGPAAVRLGGRKAGVAIAALPSTNTEEVLERIRPLFPDFAAATNVLETGLSNTNPVPHVPVMVLNAGRIDSSVPQFRFYADGITEAVGRVAAALDRERLAIAEVLGFHLSSTRDRMLDWYGDQGASGETLGTVLRTNPAFQSAMAPQTLEHRFLLEDVPFGLVPLEALGRSLGVATPVISALLTLSCELLGSDYRSQGRNLVSLGLDGLSPSQIKGVLRGSRD